jgi:signal transduction histidine kinase
MSSRIRTPLIEVQTLRGRLTVWLLGTLALTLSIFAALLYGAVSRSIYEHHDEALRRQATELTSLLRDTAPDHETVLQALAAASTSPRFVMIRDAEGALLFQEPVLLSTEPNIGRHEALVHAARDNANTAQFFNTTLELSGDVRFICVPLSPFDAFLQIGDPIGDVRATLNTVALASVGLVPVVLFLSGAVGWKVVKRALAPVRTVTATLEDIQATDLSRRVDVNPSDRDLGALVASLNHLLARLQRAFDSLRQFAGDVSHEIQTPLTVIKGAVDAGLRDPGRTRDRAWLSSLADEVESIRAIVVDLQSLALADAPITDTALVSLTEIVGEASDIVVALGELRNVSVYRSVEEGITLRGDQTRLKQVVLNLGDNAVKYTRAGGHVTIRLETADCSAILRITDTGIGISEQHLPRLFDRLFRTESAGQRAEGTGLGLAIVKRIVEAHRGVVEVHSRPGAGSTFTVRLPLS